MQISSWSILQNLLGISILGKRFEGEMFIRTIPTTLLQIFCKIILDFQVNFISIIYPDDNFNRNS